MFLAIMGKTQDTLHKYTYYMLDYNHSFLIVIHDISTNYMKKISCHP